MMCSCHDFVAWESVLLGLRRKACRSVCVLSPVALQVILRPHCDGNVCYTLCIGILLCAALGWLGSVMSHLYQFARA